MIQWMLLLRQTVESRDAAIPLLPAGSFIDLGPYADFVSFNDPNRRLRCEISLRGEAGVIRRRFGPTGLLTIGGFRPPEAAEMHLSAEFGYNLRQVRIFLQEAQVAIPSAEGPSIEVRVTRRAREVKGTRYKLSGTFKDVRFELDGVEPYRFFSVFQPTVGRRGEDWDTYLDRSQLLYSMVAIAQPLFEEIFYVGPLRELPHRYYVATGEAPTDVGLRGELAPSVLWVESKKRKEKRTDLIPRVNAWMKRLGIALEVKPLTIRGGLYNLVLTDPQTKLAVNIADVGFGASQVLPVVVECFLAPRGSLLLVEHPEIHLHPKVQSDLGDMLIEASKEKTLMVETHSEHLLSRVRRRVAEGKISKSDVAIYYFSPRPKGTRVHEVRINDLGQFEPETWPEGFFAEDLEEAMAHFRVIAEKQSGQQQ